jgi:hypothetical protein
VIVVGNDVAFGAASIVGSAGGLVEGCAMREAGIAATPPAEEASGGRRAPVGEGATGGPNEGEGPPNRAWSAAYVGGDDQ